MAISVFKYFFVQVIRIGYSMTALRPQISAHRSAHRRANNKQTVFTLEMKDVPSCATWDLKTASNYELGMSIYHQQ